ncbi:hypothetical protein V1517DRAFT_333629 [Lipomyces orientalis]|uniref:Uncharacterized protein n=1 Tax=Lipomyces orientalis TaxID=1233043 RepID=A0ACC3TDC1_9ASCO
MSALVATAASSWRTGFFYGSPLCALTLEYVFLAGRTTTTFCSSQNSARSDKRSICLALFFWCCALACIWVSWSIKISA